MKIIAAIGAAACVLGWTGLAHAQAKVCDSPKQMQGFKTCANVEKAEAEGAFVLYSTDPEAGQQKLVAAFNTAFPRSRRTTSACRPAPSTPSCCRSARLSPTWST